MLANSARGVWALTEAGVASLSGPGLGNELVWEDGQAPADAANVMVNTRGDETSWKEQLLVHLLAMHPAAFERLAQRLLREAGVEKVTVTGKSGDGGIDGRGVLRVSLVSFPVFFQCKRYQGSVGSSAIRDFRGAMSGRGDKGFFITTAAFTNEAKKEATRDGVPPIDLIDGDRLCELLKEYELGVQTQMVEAVAIDGAFFSDL